MIKRENGFTLVELMITIVIFLLVIAAASQVFTGLLTQFKQQSKIAETNIEGVVGLEMFRRDLESAGYGLPWEWTHAAASDEAINDGDTAHDDTAYNDTAANAVPRALVSGNGSGAGGSDILVIKAVNVATNTASSKWTHLFAGNTVTIWTPSTDNLVTNDRVIVIRPGTTRILALNGTEFTARYDAANSRINLLDGTAAGSSNFVPADNTETRVVYGITSPAAPVTTALRMPFNRADFYIRRPAAPNMPSRCADNTKTGFTPGTLTGNLYKATVDHAAGGLTELPLLDCVADMQVVYALDNDENGAFQSGVGGDAYSDNLVGLTAENIRNRVKEVRVYILAHEGQRDPNYTYPTNPVYVGEALVGGGRNFDFTNPDGVAGTADAITDWQNYRWKIYTLVIKPKNLR